MLVQEVHSSRQRTWFKVNMSCARSKQCSIMTWINFLHDPSSLLIVDIYIAKGCEILSVLLRIKKTLNVNNLVHSSLLPVVNCQSQDKTPIKTLLTVLRKNTEQSHFKKKIQLKIN